MVRLLAAALFGGLLLGCGPAAAVEATERHNFLLQLDLTLTQVDTPLKSWVDGGVGKFRYDELTR